MNKKFAVSSIAIVLVLVACAENRLPRTNAKSQKAVASTALFHVSSAKSQGSTEMVFSGTIEVPDPKASARAITLYAETKTTTIDQPLSLTATGTDQTTYHADAQCVIEGGQSKTDKSCDFVVAVVELDSKTRKTMYFQRGKEDAQIPQEQLDSTALNLRYSEPTQADNGLQELARALSVENLNSLRKSDTNQAQKLQLLPAFKESKSFWSSLWQSLKNTTKEVGETPNGFVSAP